MCYRIGQGLLLLLSQRNIPQPPSQGGLVYTTKKGSLLRTFLLFLLDLNQGPSD